MAKGNILLGIASGAVGDVVLSNGADGSIITRRRNRNPRTSQSPAAKLQRARFASVSSFYARGTKNLFRFAFEGKKPGISDYNAFMKYNVNNAAVLDACSYEYGSPAVSDYLLSRGSLQDIILNYDAVNYQRPTIVTAPIEKASVSQVTIGEFSRALAAQFGMEEGDFLTTVQMGSRSVQMATTIEQAKELGLNNGYEYALILGEEPRWDVNQLRLDFISEQPLSDLEMFDEEYSDPTEGNWVLLPHFKINTIYTAGEESFSGAPCYGCAAIASRNTAEGVLVSTAYVQPNARTSACILFGKSNTWANIVATMGKLATELQYKPANILQGRIAYDKQPIVSPEPGPEPEPTQPIISGSLPVTINAGTTEGSTGVTITNFSELDKENLKFQLNDHDCVYKGTGYGLTSYQDAGNGTEFLVQDSNGLVTYNSTNADVLKAIVVE